ncbi:thioredoxin domain-containing protein 15 isoform X2 [Peromyscus maniculatus bairdii]|uniref:thioredoxin domain-containing protein 15 isoform X2 n=1 Tax=Peromyscus maniculatus bairdii TaxID=230844 RepID=UPI00077D9A2C|nr:thioredoxin domain-containing protein 15 isoform X2 [Peromyscus maniculatus bairdii]
MTWEGTIDVCWSPALTSKIPKPLIGVSHSGFQYRSSTTGQKPTARLQDGVCGGRQESRWRPAATPALSGLLPQPRWGGGRDSRCRAPVVFHRGGCRRGSMSRAMHLLCWWQILLWVLGLPARGLDEESGRAWREEQPGPALQGGALYLHKEEAVQGRRDQARVAEPDEASPGPGPRGDPVVVLSVIPGAAEDQRSAEVRDGTCSALGEEDPRCGQESLFALHGAGGFSEREEEYYPEPGAAEAEPVATEDANSTDSLKSPKVNCEERNVTGLENFTLKILNMSQDLMDFLNPNGSDCTLVLFYTPWCRFSASLAPHFNSLPRAFPTLGFLALDASQHSSLSTRFGTVAVPNILLFQGAKPMARFNHTDRTLETLKIFIFNQTGIEAKKNVVVTQADRMGPLPSTLVKTVDWLLVFSLFFLISFIMYATIRTESIRWLIPGQEQEHVE